VLQAQCAEAWDGSLCKSCAPGYGRGPGNVCRKCLSSNKAATAVAFLAVRALDIVLVAALVCAVMYLWDVARGMGQNGQMVNQGPDAASCSQAGASQQQLSTSAQRSYRAGQSKSVTSIHEVHQSEKSEKSKNENSETAAQPPPQLQQGLDNVWRLGLAIMVSCVSASAIKCTLPSCQGWTALADFCRVIVVSRSGPMHQEPAAPNTSREPPTYNKWLYYARAAGAAGVAASVLPTVHHSCSTHVYSAFHGTRHLPSFSITACTDC
jgi:hypothetical protein